MAKKVLVIDDDRGTVRVLSLALEEGGYQAIGAHDGREGLRMVEEHEPDLVILDVMMPGCTGFTLFKFLKKDQRFRNLPVIMLTGVSAHLHELDQSDEDAPGGILGTVRELLRWEIVEMREEGAVRPELFIEKPLDPEYTVKKVRDLIGD